MHHCLFFDVFGIELTILKLKKNIMKAFSLLLMMTIFMSATFLEIRPTETAPDIIMENTKGETLKLSNVEAEYVLVDFWGSWCAPCRRENPQLVQFQKKYKNTQFQKANGLEVVSVAVERREASWKKAIQADGLNWKYHIIM